MQEMPSISRMTVLVACCASVAVVAWAVGYADYGMDFTDESFYLLWTGRPGDYAPTISQFGFVYHPLDRLLGGSIALLRSANLLLTFGLAWLAGSLFLREAYANRLTPFQSWTIGAVYAGSSLALFQLWLPAPNYNTLAFQSCLLVLSGLLLVKRNAGYGLAGWLCIALGGWLAFLAKPSTAMLLAMLAVLYLWIARVLRWRGLLTGLVLVIAVLLFTAFSLDGSVGGFASRIQSGVAIGQALEGGHGFSQLFRWDPWVLSPLLPPALLGLALWAAVTSVLLGSKGSLSRGLGFLSAVCSALIPVLVLSRVLTIPSFGDLQAVLLTAPLIAMVVLSAPMFQRGEPEFAEGPRANLAGVLLCLALPVAYTFGTNNNYWGAMTGAAFFWGLAAAGLGARARTRRPAWAHLLPAGMAALMVTATLLQNAVSTPYRQSGPLWTYTHPVTIGASGSRLMLDEKSASYIHALQETAMRSGFTSGTPLIDLTGRTPGAALALGARGVGQPWLIGGYRGSDAFVTMALDSASCDILAHAWLLLEPGTPFSISERVLARFGAALPSDYEVVDSITVPVGIGGRASASSQTLVKPTRAPASAVRACQDERLRRAP
jgi:hypothetical protein